MRACFQKWPGIHYANMSVRIRIFPPSDGANESELAILAGYDKIITENWVRNSGLTCNLNWERDLLVKSTKNFRLMTVQRPPREVLSESIVALSGMSEEKFQEIFVVACNPFRV